MVVDGLTSSEIRRRLGVAIGLACLAAALGPFACTRAQSGQYFSATAFAKIPPGTPYEQGKAWAIQEAYRRARDQILAQALELSFPNGELLEDAIVVDPFIRAKVYDTVRTARVTDQTIDDEDTLSVTLRLDLAPLHEIIARYGRDRPGPSARPALPASL